MPGISTFSRIIFFCHNYLARHSTASLIEAFFTLYTAALRRLHVRGCSENLGSLCMGQKLDKRRLCTSCTLLGFRWSWTCCKLDQLEMCQ